MWSPGCSRTSRTDWLLTNVPDAGAVGHADKLGVAAGHLGVGQADEARRVAPGRRRVVTEGELPPLVGPLDNDRAWHDVPPGGSGPCRLPYPAGEGKEGRDPAHASEKRAGDLRFARRWFHDRRDGAEPAGVRPPLQESPTRGCRGCEQSSPPAQVSCRTRILPTLIRIRRKIGPFDFARGKKRPMVREFRFRRGTKPPLPRAALALQRSPR